MLPTTLAFLGLGPGEWGIVLLIIVLFFGAAKIPELARSLGRAKGEFERGAREGPRKDEPTLEAQEEARVRKAAAEMGIPTEGRSVSDLKAEMRARIG